MYADVHVRFRPLVPTYERTQWRKPVAVFEGTENFFADQDDFFLKNFPLFSLIFRIFYFVRYRTQPFPRKKNTFFPILAANFFLVIRQTLLLKILGGRMHGPSPHLKLWGDCPPVPPRFPPLRGPPPSMHYAVSP